MNHNHYHYTDDDKYADDFDSPTNANANLNASHSSSFTSPSTSTFDQLYAIQQAKQLQAMLESITQPSITSSSAASLSPSVPLPAGKKSHNQNTSAVNSAITTSSFTASNTRNYRLTIHYESIYLHRQSFIQHEYTSSIAHIYIQYQHPLLNDNQIITCWPPDGYEIPPSRSSTANNDDDIEKYTHIFENEDFHTRIFHLHLSASDLLYQSALQNISVDILYRDGMGEQDVKIGTCHINLLELIHQTPNAYNDDAALISTRIYQTPIPVYSSNTSADDTKRQSNQNDADADAADTSKKPKKHIGTLNVTLQLDDLGSVDTEPSLNTQQTNKNKQAPINHQSGLTHAPIQLQSQSKNTQQAQVPRPSSTQDPPTSSVASNKSPIATQRQTHQTRSYSASPLPSHTHDRTYQSIIDSTVAAPTHMNYNNLQASARQRNSIDLHDLQHSRRSSSTAAAIAAMPPPSTHKRHLQHDDQLYDTDLAEQRATAEYQIAWELEQWRRQQQVVYEKQWQHQEAQRMAILEDEFKRQEKLRQQQYKEKLYATTQLEKQLQNTMFEIRERELQLKLQEEELAKRKQYIQQEIERGKEDALILVRRMKDQSQHQQHTSQQTINDLKQQLHDVKNERDAADQRCQQLDSEYRKLKQSIATSTTGELRLQLQHKDHEIEELKNKAVQQQNKYDTLAKRLVRALQEIDKLKKEIEMHEKERLMQEREQYERMKIMSMVSGSRSDVNRDKNELMDIRKELERLKVT